MARSDGPPNGSDHPPQNGNGHRAKQVAVALFIATTFGIMAILSFPLSGVRGPLRGPLEAALSPFERLIRPVVPWLVPQPRSAPHKPIAALPPASGRVPTLQAGPAFVPPVGSGPSGQPPGQPPAQPPGVPPPPGQPPPGTGPGQVRGLITDFLRNWSRNRTIRPSRDEWRLIQAKMAEIQSKRDACVPDPFCAKLLKQAEKVFAKLERLARRVVKDSHPGRDDGESDGRDRDGKGKSRTHEGTRREDRDREGRKKDDGDREDRDGDHRSHKKHKDAKGERAHDRESDDRRGRKDDDRSKHHRRSKQRHEKDRKHKKHHRNDGDRRHSKR